MRTFCGKPLSETPINKGFPALSENPLIIIIFIILIIDRKKALYALLRAEPVFLFTGGEKDALQAQEWGNMGLFQVTTQYKSLPPYSLIPIPQMRYYTGVAPSRS